MCGIAGIIAKTSSRAYTEQAMRRMTKTLAHRGPNGVGAHSRRADAFMNLRLAIVDIAGGNQPIWSADNSVGIVYNGEVYNYRELRRDLIAKGYAFTTDSDTEVVLRLYEEYGTEGFCKLNGMFAACIWDDRTQEVFLVRDHLGIKPLYIYEDQEKFIFASEIKAILSLPEVNRELNPAGFQDYLTYRYVQAPISMFTHIRRLDAGTFLRVKGGYGAQYRYWETSYEEPWPKPHINDVTEQLEVLLKNAVQSQLMGEVPIGVLLSGGLDSSLISYYVHSLGADLTTFNIGFPEVNEFEFSRIVAKSYGLKHIEVEMTIDQLVNNLDRVIGAIDEPIADPACFPLYQLCEELKKHVTVVLSGEGGDELFAGYNQYGQILAHHKDSHDQFGDFLKRSWYFDDALRFLNDSHIPPHHLRHRKYFEGQTTLNAMLQYDIKTWLPENLMMKADKILMAHSLEGRFPLLDRELFEYAARIPQSMKIAPDGTTKSILRSIMQPKLPPEILNRPKMGFTVPVAELLQRLRPHVEDLAESPAHYDKILNPAAIQSTVRAHYDGSRPDPLRVWTLFVMMRWFSSAYERYREMSLWETPNPQTASTEFSAASNSV